VSQTTESIGEELARRHRAAVMTVAAMLALVLLLLALTFAVDVRFALPSGLSDPTLAIALWIAIILSGLGAVALRRTKFAAMRLQDIAALQGVSGLLATLENTTVLVALLGGGIAVMGFAITMITSDKYVMLRAGVIAIAVLIYCYPRRAAWERMVQTIQTSGGVETPSAKGRTA